MSTAKPHLPQQAGMGRLVVFLLACVVVATVLIYQPTFHYPFTNWDDRSYVSDDPELRAFGWEQVKVEFSRYVVSNYHPLTMLSYSIEIKLFGKDAHVMHTTNVLIHVANVLLLFLFLYRLTGDPRIAVFAVLLFAMHPMRVESVAWISARKDVLMLFFTLLCLLAWQAWLRSGRSVHYLVALLMFAMACLSKAMAVAIVPTLFLIEMFNARSLTDPKAWLQKLPFIVIAVVMGLVAIGAQESSGAIVVERHPLLQRLTTGAANLAIYMGQQFVPIGLSARYGYPESASSGIPWHYTILALAAIVGLVLWARSKPVGLPTFGLLFFIANIVLVLQIIPVGNAVRADRYTYVAGIGWSLLAVWLLGQLHRLLGSLLGSVLPFVLAYALALGYQSHLRQAVWSDTLSLWNDMLATDPTAADILMRRATTLQYRGRYAEALPDLDGAVAFAPPGIMTPYFHRGLLHLRLGNPAAALQDLEKVYRTGERPLGLEANLVYAKFKLGRCEEVIAQAGEALGRDPDAIDMLNMRAHCLLQTGRSAEAGEDVAHSLELKQDYGDIWYLAAWTQFAKTDTVLGCAHLATSLRFSMGDPDLRKERDSLLVRSCP